ATSQCSGIAETSLAMLSDRHRAMAATASGISKPNNIVGTPASAVSAAAKYVFAAPRYLATATQPMSTADSTPAVAYRDFAEAGICAAPNQMRLSAMTITRGRTIDSNDRRYPGIWGVIV